MRLSRHTAVSRQSASKLPAVASQSSAILPGSERSFPPIRLSAFTLTYHLVAMPGRDWKRRPGRPNNRWVDQIRNDTGNMPSTLWRSATLRGHGTGVTQRPSPAYAKMMMMMKKKLSKIVIVHSRPYFVILHSVSLPGSSVQCTPYCTASSVSPAFSVLKEFGNTCLLL